MRILVNGDHREVAEGLSVGDLLSLLGIPPQGVVVERNGEILPADGRASVPLGPGDRLEIVRFVGGG
jgi:thiamine biosynthesis protein ThiS